MELYIPNNTYLKLKYFTELADGEIAGIGKTKFENNKIILLNVKILHQEASYGEANITEKGFAKFLYELEKNGENITDWNCWWHSHGEMDAFHSSTDMNTLIEQVGKMPYLISLVTNKAGKFVAKVTIYPEDKSPLKIETHYSEDLKVNVEKYPAEVLEQMKKLGQQIAKLKQKINDLKNNIVEDDKLLEYCGKEIDEKVAKIIVGFQPTTIGRTGYETNKQLTEENKKWKDIYNDDLYDDIDDYDDYFIPSKKITKYYRK